MQNLLMSLPKIKQKQITLFFSISALTSFMLKNIIPTILYVRLKPVSVWKYYTNISLYVTLTLL